MKLFLRLGLPIIAVGLFIFAVYFVLGPIRAEKQKKENPNLQPIAKQPFEKSVAGAGIIEAQTENISVSSMYAGIVAEVFVQVGDQVRINQPLFRLDDRDVKAKIEVRKAMLIAAEADLDRLKGLPRPEQIPIEAATVEQAEANLEKTSGHLARMEKLSSMNAVSVEDYEEAKRAHRVAVAELARAEASFNLLKAGAWKLEIATATAAVKRAEAELIQAETELALLTTTARAEGEVLQVNIRPGEMVGGTVSNQQPIILGNTDQLHVRVDIDEHDIRRFRSSAKAVATLKGDPNHQFDLTFVRTEQYVVPKRSLTGQPTERIDTRVLQVIYALKKGDFPLFVGQQLDVYVEEVPEPSESSGASELDE